MSAIGWTRRRFLGASAAAICVGCSDSGSGDTGGDDGDEGDDAVDDDRAVTAGTSVSNGSSPPTLPGFDGSVEVGPVDEVMGRLAAEGALYVPAARTWVVAVDVDVAMFDTYDAALHESLRAGLLGVSEKCPHLGCRVPHCTSSGWFECPCHGTRFDPIGEHRAGPAPRGMDLRVIGVSDGIVRIDLAGVVPGVPIGTVSAEREPLGPHCMTLDEA